MNSALLLKSLETALEKMGDLPPLRSIPPFPFEQFSEELAKTFEQKSCRVAHHNTQPLDHAQILEGMGESPLIEPFVLSPVPETLFLVVPKKTQKELTSILLGKGLTEPNLEEGFMKFTLLNLFETFNRINPYGTLSAALSDETPLPKSSLSGIDISLAFGEKTVWIRILVPKDANEKFDTFFQAEKTPLLESPEIAALPLSLSLSVGSTSITAKEWSQISVGDFLLLDRCTFDPESGRGTATLSLGVTPLFGVRIKEGETKILDHALTPENPPLQNLLSSDTSEDEKPLWASGDDDENTPPTQELESLTLTAEIERFEMTLAQIAKLKTGDPLELSFTDDPAIYLCAQGKRVAKGELVSLADMIGVKLLKVGV